MANELEFSQPVEELRADLAIEEIIDSARRAHGMPTTRSWFRRRLAELTSKSVRLGKDYRRITGILAVLTVIVPFIFGQMIAGLDGMPKVWAIVLAILILGTLGLANFFMPKTLAENVAVADNLKFELVINRLAGQIALQNMIQKMPVGQDRHVLEWFSEYIDPAIQRTLVGQEAKIRRVVHNCPRWKESMLSVGELGLERELDSRLCEIAESIAQVMRIIFYTTQCTVKIYLRTTHHLIEAAAPQPVHLLTSVARFPPKKQGNGKSWIECSGKDADVWQAFHRKDVLVFQHVKSAAENKTYPTIACLPLPDEFGVISIEANDPYTFMPLTAKDENEGNSSQSELRIPVPDHIIDQNLHRSLTVSVKELVLKAIRSSMPETGAAE